MAHIVIINPKFDVSYWGMEHTLDYVGKKANLPVACLPLLAALTPGEHTVRLIDENVEPIDYDEVARADIVGLTGMSVQRFRMRKILTELKARDCFVVVGGPWITVVEDYFGDDPDAIFIGEAEETWPQFLREWQEGRHQFRYEQAEKSDMTKVPVPRFDLLKMNQYAFGSLQFSRGCPFQCEFCDIIVTFGRRPRLKTKEQILAEVEAIHRTGPPIVFVVDDNLIGNKKAIKPLLQELVTWQEKHGFPLTFFTEASIDLADDPELMDLMVRANFIAVFVGIESPSDEALKETKKFQNMRDGGTLVEKVHRIQDAGMEVWCGMIMGFDSDDTGIFDRQLEFIQQTRIPYVMSGMLYAIPKTPLYDRLKAEGRIDHSDPPEYGTNIVPAQMTPAELQEGYQYVLKHLYDPEHYFKRTEELFLDPNFEIGYGKLKSYWRKHPIRRLKTEGLNFLAALYVYTRILSTLPDPVLRKEYKHRFKRFLKVHKRPGLALFYLFHLTMHYHVSKMSSDMRSKKREVVNSF